MQKLKTAVKRISSIACMALVIASGFAWTIPMVSQAATAGDVLVVRVQYYGESGDKIREKASFTRAELEAMGAATYCYSNITRVGTVMTMKAHGPKVMTVIENAGIDAGSIQNITFRTTDGYTRNFNVSNHMTGARYYYPHLSSLYDRNDAGNALTPMEGATEDRESAPSILALEFGESKQPGIHAEDLNMSTTKTYRFCMGQSDLTEGKMTDPRDDGGDITSMESCHSIYGIDVTLTGAPPEEEGENRTDDKVGTGDKNGTDGKGKNGEGKTEQKADGKNKASADTGTAQINVREIKLGDAITEEDAGKKLAEDTVVLSRGPGCSRGAAIGTAVGSGVLCGAGAISRIIKYKRNFR